MLSQWPGGKVSALRAGDRGVDPAVPGHISPVT